jgi:hypothetical protein
LYMADFQVRGELEKTNAVSKAMLLSQLPNSTPGKARKSCSGLRPTFGRTSEADHRRFPDDRWSFCRKGR